MKLIKPSFEIYEQGPGLEGIYEAIERAGRTCYKSTRPEGQTAKDFVDRMIASQHYAMLEHGTVYLTVPYNSIMEYANSQNPYYGDILCNPWTKYVIDYENDVVYISSNYRWIIENNLENWLQYLCEPTKFHEKRITVRFVCDRGVSHEFVRHRVFSFAQESTRYCNYSKDKFGKEITFIAPSWMDNTSFENVDNYLHKREFDMSFGSINLVNALSQCELCYLSMINKGLKPQQARAVLPNALKTELVMTGFVSDWKHFFDLRAIGTTGQPHPQAKELALPLLNEFITNKYF